MAFDFKKASADLANHFIGSVKKIGHRQILEGYYLDSKDNGSDYVEYMKSAARRAIGDFASSQDGVVHMDIRPTTEGQRWCGASNQVIESEMFVIRKEDYERMASMIRALSKELDKERRPIPFDVTAPFITNDVAPYPAPRIHNESRLHSREHLQP